MPSPKPFLEPALKAATADLRERLREALSEKTTAEMNALFASANALFANAKAMAPMRPTVAPETWPFGTIVTVDASMSPTFVMVVKDDGLASFSGVLLTGNVDIPTGTLLDDLHRPNWAPVTGP